MSSSFAHSYSRFKDFLISNVHLAVRRMDGKFFWTITVYSMTNVHVSVYSNSNSLFRLIFALPNVWLTSRFVHSYSWLNYFFISLETIHFVFKMFIWLWEELITLRFRIAHSCSPSDQLTDFCCWFCLFLKFQRE